MKLIPFLMLLIASLLPSVSVADTTVSGHKIPESIIVGDDELLLNGAGIRHKIFIKVYIGALYLTEPAHKADGVLAMPGSKSMRMYILYKKISARKIRNAWTEGLEDNLSKDRLAKIRPRLERFNALFPDLHKGDVVSMDYQPGKGTTVVYNGEERGSVKGGDFFSDLLQVWIGKAPADAGLKRDVLGL